MNTNHSIIFPEKSSSAEALLENGCTLFDQGRLHEAADSFLEAIKLEPELAAGWYNLGNCQIQQNQLTEAVISFNSALAIQPDLMEACYNLGVCQAALGREEEAIQCFRRTIKLKPDFLQARQELASLLGRGSLSSHELQLLQNGNLLLNEMKYPEAIESYCVLLAARPDCASAQNNLGVSLERLGKYEASRDSYAYAVELEPTNTDYILNLGAAYQQLEEYENALACYQLGAAQSPLSPDFNNNIGTILQILDKPQEAETYFRKALASDPKHAGALTNLGNSLMMQLRVDEAAECYHQTLDLIPHYAPTHLNLGMALLLSGNFKDGWREYEYRESERQDLAGPNHPRWDGSPMPGKTLLVYAEGGFGDTLMLARYLPLVKARAGCKVLLECREHLHSLIRNSDSSHMVEIYEPGKSSYDAQISLFSLPAVFETTLESIPEIWPHIDPDPAVSPGRQCFGTEKKLRVGIRWSGNPDHRNDKNRSCLLEHFLPLSEIDGIQLYSLQDGPISDSQRELMQVNHIVALEKELSSFEQTAATLKCMDIIITVDTSIAHLAGMMNLNVWTLIPYLPDWRWLLDRSDTPWYKSMKLFRQQSPGDWHSVIHRIYAEIAVYQQLAA